MECSTSKCFVNALNEASEQLKWFNLIYSDCFGLRSSDCGGYLTTAGSLSCSTNQFEMILCNTAHYLYESSLYDGWTVTVVFRWCSVGTKKPKVCQKKYPPYHQTTNNSLKHWYKTGRVHAFLLFMLTSDLQQQSRQRFANPLLSNLSVNVQTVTSVFCS